MAEGFPVLPGSFAGTAFCMKWMEGFCQNDQLFTIKLEIGYSRAKVAAIHQGLKK
jgi:hypothetical protein